MQQLREQFHDRQAEAKARAFVARRVELAVFVEDQAERFGRDPTDPQLLDASARRVAVPTLLVRGRQSDLLSPAGAAHLQELIPHARYVDVAGAGHMVAGDRNDALGDAVLTFLDELDPRP